jgi:hypothetical protein
LVWFSYRDEVVGVFVRFSCAASLEEVKQALISYNLVMLI